MTTSLSVTVDATGIHAPDFGTVLAGVQAKFRSIYGDDIYLDPSSSDGQWVAAIALMIHDCNMACLATWANFSPLTAVGVGLSSMVKINGIRRIAATYSTCVVTLTGVGAPNTVIHNGIIADVNSGQTWALPDVVTIDVSGTVAVTATCTSPGPITAAPGDLSVIQTPVSGWQTVSNAAAATEGTDAESDGALRTRQAQSTQLPSLTVEGAILANVEDVDGVQHAAIYTNNTGSTDTNGIAAHSFAVVVSGGDAVEIATAIMRAKGPGPATVGTTSETLINSVGQSETIRFTVPTQVHIKVNITVKAGSGYTTTTTAEIKQALASSQVENVSGEDVKWASLFLPAQLVLDPTAAADFLAQFGLPITPADASTYSVTSLTIYRDSNPAAESDIVIAYNEVAVMVPADVTVTVT